MENIQHRPRLDWVACHSQQYGKGENRLSILNLRSSFMMINRKTIKKKQGNRKVHHQWQTSPEEKKQQTKPFVPSSAR